MHNKLFRGLSTSHLLLHQDPRPHTSSLAQYVVDQLPLDLEACTRGDMALDKLAATHTPLLAVEASRIRGITAATEAREAQLDMVMLLGAYLLAKDEAFAYAPSLLLTLLADNALAHGLPERMTYELIVDVNTECFVRSGGHVRAFSRGTIGRIERDFYVGHHFAEQHMRSAYETLRDVLQEPDASNKTARLRSVLTALQSFTEYMAAYARLPHREYAYFRQFLRPYPDKVKNASGAFMPSPQLFEMLLQASAFAQATYISQNSQYFPGWAQQELQTQSSRTDGATLESMLTSGRLSLSDAERALAAAIVEQFINFKLTHIQVASSKIPEAFPAPPMTDRETLRGFCPFLGATRSGEGLQQGTGGFSPQDFLGDGVRRLLELQLRLSL